MTTVSVENAFHWIGGLLAYGTLVVLLQGIWSGTRRSPGLKTGMRPAWLHSAWFYLASTLAFIALSALGWKPIHFELQTAAHGISQGIGCLLFFPGVILLLWARFQLGRNYFVSSGFGAQLFEDQQLIVSGPYAIVRHPMYLGLILAALGGFFLYQTWTALLYAFFAPFITLRLHQEEKILAEQFGVAWKEYCKKVPKLFPKRILSN